MSRHGPHDVLFLLNNNNMYINYILICMFYQYFNYIGTYNDNILI